MPNGCSEVHAALRRLISLRRSIRKRERPSLGVRGVANSEDASLFWTFEAARHPLPVTGQNFLAATGRLSVRQRSNEGVRFLARLGQVSILALHCKLCLSCVPAPVLKSCF